LRTLLDFSIETQISGVGGASFSLIEREATSCKLMIPAEWRSTDHQPQHDSDNSLVCGFSNYPSKEAPMKPSGMIRFLSVLMLVGCGPSAAMGDSDQRDASAGASETNSAAATSQAEAQIRELDQMQARAWVARDQAALEQLWSPEFVLNAPSNQIRTREGVFREMRTPRLRESVPMERTLERVTPFGDIMISMGVEHHGPKNGPAANPVRTQRYTNVWGREGDTWRIIARHAHMLPLDSDN
jgi:ketosteroid isomerase-like protein